LQRPGEPGAAAFHITDQNLSLLLLLLLLQGSCSDQESRVQLRAAINAGRSCVVQLMNFRCGLLRFVVPYACSISLLFLHLKPAVRGIVVMVLCGWIIDRVPPSPLGAPV
jgi:hypothetical protein